MAGTLLVGQNFTLNLQIVVLQTGAAFCNQIERPNRTVLGRTASGSVRTASLQIQYRIFIELCMERKRAALAGNRFTWDRFSGNGMNPLDTVIARFEIDRKVAFFGLIDEVFLARSS